MGGVFDRLDHGHAQQIPRGDHSLQGAAAYDRHVPVAALDEPLIDVEDGLGGTGAIGVGGHPGANLFRPGVFRRGGEANQITFRDDAHRSSTFHDDDRPHPVLAHPQRDVSHGLRGRCRDRR